MYLDRYELGILYSIVTNLFPSRDTEKQVAEATGALAKAMNQTVVAANAQVQKSSAAVTAAQT